MQVPSRRGEPAWTASTATRFVRSTARGRSSPIWTVSGVISRATRTSAAWASKGRGMVASARARTFPRKSPGSSSCKCARGSSRSRAPARTCALAFPGLRTWALARLGPITWALAGLLARPGPRPHIQALVPWLAPLSTHGPWLPLVSSYACARNTPWPTRVPMWALARPLRRVGAGGRVCSAEGPSPPAPPPHLPCSRHWGRSLVRHSSTGGAGAKS